MLAENLVVKGIYFIEKQDNKEAIELIKSIKPLLERNLANKGYQHVGPSDYFYNSLEMDFRLRIPNKKVPFMRKLFRSEEELEQLAYNERLTVTRSSTPWRVKIYLYLGKLRESEGLYVEIISEPTIFYKIEQLGYSSDLDYEDYSRIIYENKQFVSGTAKSTTLRTVREAGPLSDIVKTKVSAALASYKFDKVSQELEKGRGKIERGEDGKEHLIGVIENFLFELVERIGKKPSGRHSPQKNIEELRKAGYISLTIQNSLLASIHKGVYSPLKDKEHKRESIDLFDMRLYFAQTEATIDYLIKKLLKYKVKLIQDDSKKQIEES